MKIGDERSLVNLDAYVKSTQNNQGLEASHEQDAKKAVRSENVELSYKARELQKAREVIEATPEIREEKVGQFKKQIEAGTYEVRGNQIAENMLRESIIDAFA